MKKLLLTLTLALLLPQIASADLPFKDVPTDHWAYEDIEALYNRGVIDGKTEDHFGLNDQTTVAEFTKMLMGVVELDPQDHFIGANDNPAVRFEDWFFEYMTAAQNLNFFAFPFNNNQVEQRPNQPLTRMEAAGMMVMALQPESLYKSITVGRFRDLQVDSLERCYAIKLASYDIMRGYQERYLPFKPENQLTRAESAVVINRIYKSFFDSDPRFTDENEIIPGNGTVYEHCEAQRDYFLHTNSDFGFQLVFPSTWGNLQEQFLPGPEIVLSTQEDSNHRSLHLIPVEIAAEKGLPIGSEGQVNTFYGGFNDSYTIYLRTFDCPNAEPSCEVNEEVSQEVKEELEKITESFEAIEIKKSSI